MLDLEYAPLPPPEPEVVPDPTPVLQLRPGGGIENVKERIYVFFNRHLKVSPKYTTTHDVELHLESLTILGIMYYKPFLSQNVFELFFFFFKVCRSSMSQLKALIFRKEEICVPH
jgi:hypothetical protein